MSVESPSVSVVIPAFREEEYIEATLRGIVEAFRVAKIPLEILVVVDTVPGDQTVSYIRNVAKVYDEIRIFERRGRRGVGDAIQTGIKDAKGKIVIPVMGDQSEYPSDVVALVRKAEHCDVVFTCRFRHGRPPGYPVLKYVANRSCNFAAMLLFGIPYSDTTNAFKAYRKKLLDRIDLVSRGFEVFLEMPVKAMTFTDVRTDEIEVRHNVRKKRAPKLSVLRDGYAYAALLLSLLGNRARAHQWSSGNAIS